MASAKQKNEKRKTIIAVCGVKNSGKTTLICRLIPKLMEKGLKVATIKHDGHEFQSDVPGTDSYEHQRAGAYGTAVFSGSQFLVTKREAGLTVEQMAVFFPEADLILLEGCKDCSYPKIEVIRQINGNTPVSNPQGRFLIVTDQPLDSAEKCLDFEEIDEIVQEIMSMMNMENNN